MITVATLKALEPNIKPANADVYAPALEAARISAGINTPMEVSHFMAQLATESAGFRTLIESLAYKDPVRLDKLFSAVKGVEHAKRLIAGGQVAIGNCIYAGRLGNGDEASGDGYRYRGRGFIMVTGRANYKGLGAKIGQPLEDEPSRLGDPDSAALASAQFWKSRNIGAPANRDDVEEVTRLVNGPALEGLASRKAYLAKAKTIWR